MCNQLLTFSKCFFFILPGRFLNLLFIPNFWDSTMIQFGVRFVSTVILGTQQNFLSFSSYIISFLFFFLPFTSFLFMRSWTTWIVYLISSLVPRFISSCFGLFTLGCVVVVVTLFSGKFSILVSQGYHKKVPQNECFNNRNLFCHNSGGWKPKASCQWGWCPMHLSPWPAEGSPLAASSHGRPSAHAHPWCLRVA